MDKILTHRMDVINNEINFMCYNMVANHFRLILKLYLCIEVQCESIQSTPGCLSFRSTLGKGPLVSRYLYTLYSTLTPPTFHLSMRNGNRPDCSEMSQFRRTALICTVNLVNLVFWGASQRCHQMYICHTILRGTAA